MKDQRASQYDTVSYIYYCCNKVYNIIGNKKKLLETFCHH